MESHVGNGDSAFEFHPIATRGAAETLLRTTEVRSRHISDETSPSPRPQQPQPSESPVVFRLREESATTSNLLVAASTPAVVS